MGYATYDEGQSSFIMSSSKSSLLIIYHHFLGKKTHTKKPMQKSIKLCSL